MTDDGSSNILRGVTLPDLPDADGTGEGQDRLESPQVWPQNPALSHDQRCEQELAEAMQVVDSLTPMIERHLAEARELLRRYRLTPPGDPLPHAEADALLERLDRIT